MNTADKNGFCPLRSTTPFTIPGRGGSIMDVQSIRVVSPVLATSHLQPAFVPPNHRHPPAYTPYIYSLFDTVEAGGRMTRLVVSEEKIRRNLYQSQIFDALRKVLKWVLIKIPKWKPRKMVLLKESNWTLGIVIR